MNNILIIYPHWHPSNLAGVHRPRLLGNYLSGFGWNPYVLTVREEYFEEKPDPDLIRAFSPEFRVTRVKAFRVTKPRIIGDIGLRAFIQIRRKAIEICRNEQIDFIWIPVPSFYMSLMGRILHRKTAIPYGIDYIDPWVRDITNQKSVRAVVSQWLARSLEPIAVKKASLITGVSYEYYRPVLERNFTRSKKKHTHQSVQNNGHFRDGPRHVAFPYGFDPNDHKIKLEDPVYPWGKTGRETGNKTGGETGRKIWLYAGAFLPNSHLFLEKLFGVISKLKKEPAGMSSSLLKNLSEIQLWFVGTGQYPAKQLTSYAKEHGIDDMVYEIRDRFPYLQTLNFLSAADTVMIIGSTEKHYTASKTYQTILSGRPVWTVLHEESQALEVLKACEADSYCSVYREKMSEEELSVELKRTLLARLASNTWQPNLTALDKYSAASSAKVFAGQLDEIIAINEQSRQ